jgi:hypothetical protein
MTAYSRLNREKLIALIMKSDSLKSLRDQDFANATKRNLIHMIEDARQAH